MSVAPVHIIHGSSDRSLRSSVLLRDDLRATERNRKIQLSTSITQRLGTKEFQRDYIELSALDWRDPDDFRKRYDHRVNHESFAQRWSVWGTYDNLGYLLREGLVDRDIMFNSLGFGSVMIWGRYKPVIDDIRRRGSWGLGGSRISSTSLGRCCDC